METRDFPCGDCGHAGSQHLFSLGYTGNNYCLITDCKCSQYLKPRVNQAMAEN